MTATLTEPGTPGTPGAPEAAVRPASVARGYRFELVKLVSQWRIRLLVLACWIAPALFVAVVSQQSDLPVDTVFGRWMNATGWAGSLVMLGFAGSYALPLLTSVVAGDVFASEDRLGTWRHLLVAVRSYRRIFAAKVLASLTVILVLVAGLAVSSVVGGVLGAGDNQLVGLDGHLLSPGAAAGQVLLAWVVALAPTLALAAVGLLGSVALGRSPMGLLLPALVALAMAVAQLLPLPVALRFALPTYAFISWEGLFTSPAQTGPVLISVAVCLVWTVVATALAYFLFLRRDFTNLSYDGSARRTITVGALPLVGLIVVAFAVLAAATPSLGSGVTQDKVQRSLSVAFAHLYRLQTDELHRPAVTEAQLDVTSACTKGGDLVPQEGPGNDWRCVVTWHLPDVATTGQAIYQLDVTSDGRYVADGDGPKEVNGYFQVRTPIGDQPNPMWQFDGNVELL
ncbi:ABC transporter permease [Amycolatopsis rhabdoformis]|uniref:ABC transporter permease n=1 Tax=Amycolatopsis rhabdoformis TaxID=1448059 RepID=A0ABZ1I928_9PSEU|nr:ABC transporter permease [Amycolatopsis rhabdoformis]WSE30697.1 ABC transporter permease [Amycolatopsis rhabdoformis]